MNQPLSKIAQSMDWGQVLANGGPPCFHVEDGGFCLRAQRWDGHFTAGFHNYVSLSDLLRALEGK